MLHNSAVCQHFVTWAVPRTTRGRNLLSDKKFFFRAFCCEFGFEQLWNKKYVTARNYYSVYSHVTSGLILCLSRLISLEAQEQGCFEGSLIWGFDTLRNRESYQTVSFRQKIWNTCRLYLLKSKSKDIIKRFESYRLWSDIRTTKLYRS